MTHLTPQDIQIIVDSLDYRIEQMRLATDPVTIRERVNTQAVLDKLNQPVRLQTWQEDH